MEENNKKVSVLSELTSWFLDRKSGLLYTIYSTAFILFNWKFFYVLFVSSEYSGQRRIAEALNEFVSRSIWNISYGWLIVFQFIIPALVTYAVIFLLPILNNYAFKKSLLFKKERDLDQLKSEAETEEEKAKLLRSKVESISDQVESYGDLESQVNELLKQVALLQGQIGKDVPTSLKEEEIYVEINGTKVIGPEQTLKLSLNKDYSLQIKIFNGSKVMAKQIEVGIRFDSDILEVSKSSGYNIYKDEKTTVIRYQENFIHANTLQHEEDLAIKTLKAGEFKVRIFIKGENFTAISRTLMLEIID